MLWKKYILLCLSLLLCFMYGININTECKAAQNFTMQEIELNKPINDIVNALVNKFNLNINKTFRVGSTTTYNSFEDFKSQILQDGYNSFHFTYYFNGNGNSYWSEMTTGYQSIASNTYNTGNFTIEYGISVNNLANNTTGSWANYGRAANIGASTNNNNHSYYVLLRDKNEKWFEYSYDSFSIVNAFLPKYEDNFHSTITIQNIKYYNPQYNRSVARWYIGNIINVDDFTKLKVYYQQFDGTNWNDKGQLQFVDVSDGHAEVYFYNPITLYNQAYRIYFTYDNNTSEYYYYYFTPYGTSANSGDIPIYTGNDNNNGIIENQYQQENQDFWRNAYNSLFTISGDYISKKFEEIRQEYNISGDYEIEKAFIEQIQENADDFIISWEPMETHFTFGNYENYTKQILFPSGEINFSKMERENEDLHTTMEWARTIIGFSLGILLLRNYWTTLLLMLGIGIQVYDKEDTEKQAVTTQTITIDTKGNKTLTETTKKGNFTIRRVKK